MTNLAKPLQILEIIGPVDDYVLEHYFTIRTNHGTFRLRMGINDLFELNTLSDIHGEQKARNMILGKKLEEELKKSSKQLPDETH